MLHMILGDVLPAFGAFQRGKRAWHAVPGMPDNVNYYMPIFAIAWKWQEDVPIASPAW